MSRAERSGFCPAGVRARVRSFLGFLRDPTHGIDEGGKVVARRGSRLEVGGQAHDLPAEGRREVLGVFVTQVVGVRVGHGGQRADDDRGVLVVVGQSRDGSR